MNIFCGKLKVIGKLSKKCRGYNNIGTKYL